MPIVAQASFDIGQYDRAVPLFDAATIRFKSAVKSARLRQQSTEAVTSEPNPRVSESTPQARKAEKPRVEPKPRPRSTRNLAADVKRERQAMLGAKAESERVSGGELAEIAYSAAAFDKEEAAERLVLSGDLETAIARFREAKELYFVAAEQARQTTATEQRESETFRQRVRETKAMMPANVEFLGEYREAVALEREADDQMGRQRYATASRKYESAIAKYEAAKRKREQQESDIRNVVRQYAAALEAEDVGRLESLHVTLTRPARDDWNRFFDSVTDLRARVSVDYIEFNERGATTRVSVQFLYSGAGSSDETHKWDMVMQQQGGNWLIAEVRRKT